MEPETFSRDASITTDMFNNSFRPDLERKLRLFADFGFRFVHWCDDWDNEVLYSEEDIGRYCQLLESCGLRCVDVHGADTSVVNIAADKDGDLDRYIKLLENRIQFCAAAGGDAVVIHPPDDGGVPSALDRKLNRSLVVFESVRPLCESLSVVLAIENCFASDVKTLRYYFERYPPEFVGFCFDSGHANLNGNLDPLMKFGDRLKAVHLHDNKGIEDDHQPPFWGTIDWEKTMRWIQQSGYRKPISFEITHYPELFDGTMDEFLDYSVHSVERTLALIGSQSRERA